jgi:hypothetical protein
MSLDGFVAGPSQSFEKPVWGLAACASTNGCFPSRSGPVIHLKFARDVSAA